jgi:cytochrome b6-f complex iron-sulfur subunit/menaquinol-cytochrome c reductase iron-sulfur subunit
MVDDAKASRRGALKVLAAAGGAIGCGALAIPAVRLLVAPVHGGEGAGRWTRAVRLDALREGEPKHVSLIADRRDAWTVEKAVELGAVWLVRQGDAVHAWSVICPHLGCAVVQTAAASGFACPCHDSAFDAEGRRLSGPSPRDLDPLATRVEDGIVSVEYRRFRQGIPNRVTVS